MNTHFVNMANDERFSLSLCLKIHFVLTILLILLPISTMAQIDEPTPFRQKQKWATGGLLMLLSPRIDYYDKNLERYSPPVPMVWFGPSWLNDAKTGDGSPKFPLSNGVFSKIDCGFTILQISRNLYRGIVGVTAGFQLESYIYNVSNGYHAEKDGHRVDFVPSDDEHKSKKISFSSLRIPLLIGAQTNNRLFSIQTGFGLYHSSRLGCQWMVTAGLGPFTVNYSRNLTPLFKLNDGTKAHPMSLTIGVDVWYWLCRFSHPNSNSR